MIEFDKSRSTPVSEQLVEQMRYLIASGQYRPGEALPSTRALGEQVGISFHTVRKAYQALVAEGYLSAKKGSGYVVVDRAPLETSDRTERGAAILGAALQQVIALGYDASELGDLVAEQLDLLDLGQARYRVLIAAPTTELAGMLAEQIKRAASSRVEVVSLRELPKHADADFVITPFPHLRTALDALPRADVRGVPVTLSPDALARAARLLDHHTLALVTTQPQTLAPLTAQIRRETAFGGQVLTLPLDSDAEALRDLAEEADLVLYTPACRRRLAARLKHAHASAMVAWRMSEDDVRRIVEALPV